MEIDFGAIEKKWQEKWEKNKIFQVSEDSEKEKFYVLEMFPYPSGTGLHMGHALNYTIGDILARFKIMKGFNVLHPMGFDALGLPAENAAIKAGTDPEKYTNDAIGNFVRQQKALGVTYDWSRMVNTASPDYYKWDQWIFLKMLEKGLAYQKESAVNWCPKCDTVLANEQVNEGKCWRHEDTDVEVRKLKQWFFRTTEYADELLAGLDKIDWPERTKIMQRNWIGRSEGVEISFEVEKGEGNPRICANGRESGIGNVVIVHGGNAEKDKDYNKHFIPWIRERLEDDGINVETPQMPVDSKATYEDWKRIFDKIKIDCNSILVGHSRGGAFLARWIGETKKKIKKLILVAPCKAATVNYKKTFYDFDISSELNDLAKEIVVFFSDNDEEHMLESIKEYRKVLKGKFIEIKGKGHFTGIEMNSGFPKLLEEIKPRKDAEGRGQKNAWKVFTTRPDTVFGVTFMVVASGHDRLDELVTAEQRKAVDGYLKNVHSVSEKDVERNEKVGVFSGSYAVNPANSERVPIWIGNFVLADYGSGMVMGVPAHDRRDFEFAKKYGIEVRQVVANKDPLDFKNKYTGEKAFVEDGILMSSKQFSGMDNVDAKTEITNWLSEKGVAKSVVNFKLRDWGVSRQRYWGTPIPIVYCESCGTVPVSEKDLPVVLPKDVRFGKGNPLESNEGWLKAECPKCGKVGRRESDTMDTFVNSSWYFLRYADPKNAESIFDFDKVKYWNPVDVYIGGAEHACMHLLYARFYVKFLRDIGVLDFDEPFMKLFHQGMLRAEDGRKMSKSLGNVVEPIETMRKYGVDATRWFLISVASPDKDFDWSERGISGSTRFIKKVFDFYDSSVVGGRWSEKDSAELLVKFNLTLKNLEEYYGNFEYRKATIELRELFGFIEKGCSVELAKNFLKIIAPICPHVAEELWEKLRFSSGVSDECLSSEEFVSVAAWPEVGGEDILDVENFEDFNEKIISRVMDIIKEGVETVFIYVMPFELDKINLEKIGEKIGKVVKVFAVNDSEKHDPKGMAKKAKPGLASIYLE